MTSVDPELDFLRQVEDLFAASRGLPHILSPKDVQLVRTWFAEGIPIAAIASGVTEAIEKKRESADGDVVVSLSYCRHAVRRHAKRIAAAAVGSEHSGGSGQQVVTEALAQLCNALDRTGADLESSHPTVSAVVLDIVGRLRTAKGADRNTLDELLFALESELLRRCHEALTDEERESVDARVIGLLAAANVPEASRRRIGDAHRDRLVRETLRLPRLEIP